MSQLPGCWDSTAGDTAKEQKVSTQRDGSGGTRVSEGHKEAVLEAPEGQRLQAGLKAPRAGAGLGCASPECQVSPLSWQ